MLIDISVEVNENTLAFPGDSAFHKKKVSSIKKGDDCNLHDFSMCTHIGTHIDAPYHFNEKEKDISLVELSQFDLPAIVIDVKGKKIIEVEDIEKYNFDNIEAVLFKTDSQDLLFEKEFSEKFTELSYDAAQVLINKGISMVGIDYVTFEKGDYLIHRLFSKNNVFILECLDLRSVSSGNYRLMCFPIKLSGLEASPVRAVLETNI